MIIFFIPSQTFVYLLPNSLKNKNVALADVELSMIGTWEKTHTNSVFSGTRLASLICMEMAYTCLSASRKRGKVSPQKMGQNDSQWLSDYNHN